MQSIEAASAPTADGLHGDQDLGPLAWVLEELQKSLDGSVKALRRFVRDAELARGSDLAALDASALRVARQQLHQASGALEMVGMEPPAVVLKAMEAAVQKFVQRPESCSDEAANAIERASFALSEYLAAVLAGKVVSPVGLFPQYRDVQALVGGASVHPADLWPAERRFREPNTALPERPAVYDTDARTRLDRALLQTIKSGDAAAARELSTMCLALAGGQSERQIRTFWKISAGFFEAIALGLVPVDVYVKRVASRVLLQYTALARGETRVADRLLQDLLFFCAQAKSATPAPALNAVRATFALDRFPPVDYEVMRFGRYDPAVLVQARKRIAAATETWSALAGGDRNKFKPAVDQFSLVSDSLRKLLPDSEGLATALMHAIDTTTRSGEPPSPALAMEVATAVLYLQAAFEDLDAGDGRIAERTASLAQRLERVTAGGDSEPLEPWMEELYRRISDHQTMGSVVDELRATLAEAEKSLDQYFRNPADKDALMPAPGHLAQMRGVLSVLGLDQASLAVMRMRESVERLLVDPPLDDAARHAVFEKLGNSLGALGFLIDMLSYQRVLARKLFVYDEDAGELRILMGRTRARTYDSTEAATVYVEERAVMLEAPQLPEIVRDLLDSEHLQPLTTVPLPVAAGPVAAPAPVVDAAPPADEGGDDDDDLLQIFLDEAREVVESGLSAVAALRDEPGDLTQQTTLRRAFHTLKGSSRMVGLAEFGEAAWALEQVLNAWLAQQKPAYPELLALSQDALQAFGKWADDIGAGNATAWQAQGFRTAADAMRLEGRAVALQTPATPQAEVSVATITDIEISPAGTHAVEEQHAIAESAPADGGEKDQPWVPTDIAPLAELDHASEEAQVPSAEETPAPASMAWEATDAAPLLEMVGRTAEAEQPAEPLLSLAEAEEVDFSQFAAALAENDVQAALEKEQGASSDEESVLASVPADEVPTDRPGIAPADVFAEDVTAILGDGVAPGGFDGQPLPVPDALPAIAQAPVAVVPDDSAVSPLDAASEAGEVSVKVIGPLRIGIPLYNVYLNEADEWSRRLQTALAEWSLELHEPLSDTPMALAHSLAGSSATVGFLALSDLARLLEHALQHVQLQSHGQPDQARAFIAAAEDIRRLLHQFAAGFLKDADAEVLNGLRDILATEIGSTLSPEELSPNDSGWGHMAQVPFVQEDVPAIPVESTSTPLVEPAHSHSPQPQGFVDANQRMEDAIARAVTATSDIDDDIDVMDVIDPDLFPIFEEEAIELLPHVGGALRQWADRPDHTDARSEVLRALHTLKGSSRLAGALRLGEMAHRLESAIEQIGSENVHSADVEPLLASFDALQANFDALRAISTQAEAEADGAAQTPAVAQALPESGPEQPVEALPAVAAAPAPAMPVIRPAATFNMQAPSPLRAAGSQSVRVRSQLLERLVNQAGEVMITRSRLESRLGQLRGSLTDLTGNLDRLRQQLRDIELQAESQMQSRLAQAKDSAAGFDPLEFDRFTRVQELTRMMAESVNDVATVQRNLQRTMEGAEDDLVAQGRQARELQRDLLRTRMVEFEGISERLYAVVRQASKETGKQIKLDITGGSIEMDRGVLDRMTPAFEHLLRNAVVHGIEDPQQRQAAGKSGVGTITVGVHQEGNDVSVTFGDDGAGLNFARIRDKAVEQGLVAADAVLDDASAAEMIFMPGFSTATEVTGLAGRGIGMDVVRSEVQALGGRIETTSQLGRGTSFKMVLPLTTAVTQVVMLRAGALTLGVPANVVEIVRRVPAADLARAYQSGHFDFNGDALPFFWCGALLQASLRSAEPPAKTHPVVIVRSAAQRIALHVDEVLGNQEVVVKNLGPQMSRLPGMAGMSVLASGAVVLIYNPVALATVYGDQVRDLSAAAMAAVPDVDAPPQLQATANAPSQVPLVLVVDDSITVRRVTQRLLQREGYRVVLAADGLQALERLQGERPTVVLSDIEMPRMDGFDLARNIRADAALRELPIIMITSRIAEKHREHAMELGVNHYLGKPYSEEELLSLVRRYAVADAVPA
ncbi:Hpt domain-containing protein [Ramlibacter sp. H39-3-26]|uniref:hybrid sensor histidine kinase/response regulator n=1 Tax=Curvibacter soli TaxID=3031331 RepID=UPI0023DAC505|nr:Hpt domain-containing protein [Ramlibacter sp. H39-3-26]MDF1484864.1 Hpt domain-containing protein [Ramlibacter sp. H39-3-26]